MPVFFIESNSFFYTILYIYLFNPFHFGDFLKYKNTHIFDWHNSEWWKDVKESGDIKISNSMCQSNCTSFQAGVLSMNCFEAWSIVTWNCSTQLKANLAPIFIAQHPSQKWAKFCNYPLAFIAWTYQYFWDFLLLFYHVEDILIFQILSIGCMIPGISKNQISVVGHFQFNNILGLTTAHINVLAHLPSFIILQQHFNHSLSHH